MGVEIPLGTSPSIQDMKEQKGKDTLSSRSFVRWRDRFTMPHPTWQSKESRSRVLRFLCQEQLRAPKGRRLNVGSASRRFSVKTINLDLFSGREVDIQGDVMHLPLKNECIDTILCTGVLEHVSDPPLAVMEIDRVLKFTGRIFLETPFMQTIHAAPKDYYRWTPDGLRQLMKSFDILEIQVVAGPASALAWTAQQAMAMLFSFGSEFLYKAGMRIFGWMAMPLSWLDIVLEKNPWAGYAASGFAVLAVKKSPK